MAVARSISITGSQDQTLLRFPSYGFISSLLLFLLLLGCGPGEAPIPSELSNAERPGSMEYSEQDTNTKLGSAGAEGVLSPTSETSFSNRKVIYKGTLELLVNDFDDSYNKLHQAVNSAQGYIANQETAHQDGRTPHGNWTVRIPVAQFQEFVNQLDGLGSVLRQNIDAEEVTDEYVDLQARITNEKRLEERVQKLYERTPDKIGDIISVEKELARVRQNIERMEGRLRLLNDQTTLATLEISMRQRQKEVAPEIATYSTRLSEAWSGMTSETLTWFQDLSIGLIQNLPRLVFLLMVGLIVGPLAWRFRHLLPAVLERVPGSQPTSPPQS